MVQTILDSLKTCQDMQSAVESGIALAVGRLHAGGLAGAALGSRKGVVLHCAHVFEDVSCEPKAMPAEASVCTARAHVPYSGRIFMCVVIHFN